MKIKKYFKEEGSVSTQYGDHYNFIITVDEVDEARDHTTNATVPIIFHLKNIVS